VDGVRCTFGANRCPYRTGHYVIADGGYHTQHDERHYAKGIYKQCTPSMNLIALWFASSDQESVDFSIPKAEAKKKQDLRSTAFLQYFSLLVLAPRITLFCKMFLTTSFKT
jgi:hypothetical protein